ncbi:hypothetical protein LTS18_012381 [Coniosporium uncinatum]|uniref:Uncharacterized protein n=1 Tax=Coniosporium uncinatum TaxID=93489 RepID=A0ACC3DYZ8_9PEZI|nr:hypothetical protein LTS18_012381 [Coniosporium uncinatum]
MQMRASFRAIRFGLMVGIGSGVPSAEADVRLGGVVVSQPDKGHGGVIQYDFGKSTPGGFERTGFLNTPPQLLLGAVAKLRANHDRGRSKLVAHLSTLSKLPKFSRDEAGEDILFEGGYNHAGGKSCISCDDTRQLQREVRTEDAPQLHYGTIASGNQVMRDGASRDQISAEFGGVLCFEMEAAGLMDSFPCLVVRGICDYVDSHKDKRWQGYAAGTKTQTSQNQSTTSPCCRTASLLVEKVAISGLGGIGKTQVALQFAYYVKEGRPDTSIFWVQALSMETFEQGCMEIVGALGSQQGQDSKEDVKKQCSGDYAEDLLRGSEQTEGLLAFLPENEHGLITFTTRHGEIAQQLASSDIVEIGKMREQETVDLLEKSLVRKSPPYNAEIVTKLLTELDYLPLAVTQAAAYINTNKSSISEYLRLLRNTKQDATVLMSTEFGDKTRYQNLTNAVAKTWTITFNKIRQRDTIAADLLAFIACIEWKAIPLSILPAVQPEARMASAIGTLCSYSCLERREDGEEFDMHRLVHLATRIWTVQNGREKETRKEAIRHLSEVFPSDDYTKRELWRDDLPHVARVYDDDDDDDDDDERENQIAAKSELCLKVGRCLYVDGRMREAVPWLQDSCEWRKRKLDKDDPDLLLSQHVLAMAYQANGQVKQAVELLERVVAIKAEVLAEDHPSRLVSEQVLAAFLEDLPERSETSQTSDRSIEDVVAEYDDAQGYI